MALISVTRLRVRALRFMPAFALHAVRTRQQVRRAGGFRGGALLPDRAWTFWTMTVWDDEASMRGYILAGSHRMAMSHLLEWCDEASAVHWEQPEARLVPWAEAERRMREEGHPSRVRHPSPQHAALGFRAPRIRGSGGISPAG